MYLSLLTTVAVLGELMLVSSVKVGIIGGGVGGASAAFFIRKVFGEDANIHLYEQHSLGGRLALAEFNGHQYEEGGSIIHTNNKYIMDFIKLFGLAQKQSSTFDTFGLWNGGHFVFTSSSWSAVTAAKLFWRYGLDFIKLERLITATLVKFHRIYDLLDSGAAYDTVEDLIMAMDPSLIKLTEIPFAQYLKLSGLRSQFVDELVAAMTLNNYGQRPDVHAFVGMVAVAGSSSGQLISVLGGNHQLAERAVQAAGATLHRERVLSINETGSGFVLTSSPATPAAASPVVRPFDVVLVAAPQTSDHVPVRWHGRPPPPRFPGTYYNLSVTLVAGTLRPSAFSAASLPTEILATTECHQFNSLGIVTPADDTAGDGAATTVHKMFTSQEPDEQQLQQLFGSDRSQRGRSWLAYPRYRAPMVLGNFTLRHHLYYLNSIEAAASAMEMSAIAARNVANMAYARWYNRPPADLRPAGVHTEL